MRKLLIIIILFVISSHFTMIYSMSKQVESLKHLKGDVQKVFTPKICDRVALYLSYNRPAQILCIDFIKEFDSSLSFAKADMIIRNNLGLHPDYTFYCLIYLYGYFGKEEIRYSLKKYISQSELVEVDRLVTTGINLISKVREERKYDTNKKIDEAKQKRNETLNKIFLGLENKPSEDNTEKKIEYESVDLNIYGRIAYPNDLYTDWNHTETDNRIDSILTANQIIFKDGQWVKKIKKQNYSGSSYSINSRQLIGKMESPAYDSDVEGKVTINIRVDENGSVISAFVGSPTTISDKETLQASVKAALSTKFSKGEGISTGSITYGFKLK